MEFKLPEGVLADGSRLRLLCVLARYAGTIGTVVERREDFSRGKVLAYTCGAWAIVLSTLTNDLLSDSLRIGKSPETTEQVAWDLVHFLRRELVSEDTE